MTTQVLAQNATQLAVSTPEVIDVGELVRRQVERKVSGSTLASAVFNRSKVFSAVCADWKSLRNVPKENRVPEDVAALINREMDAIANVTMTVVRPDNLISVRSKFYHNRKDKLVTKRHTIVGEDTCELSEQKFGALLLLGEAKVRLAKAVEKYDDKEKIERMQANVDSLTATRAHISVTMGRLAAEQKKAAE